MKIVEQKRTGEVTKLTSLVKKLHDYAYMETFILVVLYLTFGFFKDRNDVCILNGQLSYILILLSIITLFHGFESGLFGIGLIALAMWFFYPTFDYVQFLFTLMMILIFSQFHYYWTKKIRETELNSEYKNIKLNELSRAFYTLKISHDQLEKNYVTKPMSLRNSIMFIKESKGNTKEKFESFLKLLEKSFNVSSASLAQLNPTDTKNENFEILAKSDEAHAQIDLKDPLIQKSIELKKPIFISDEELNQSRYVAVIPSLENEKTTGLLLIEKMPFLAFNRENLTSIAIILEYFFNEIQKGNILSNYNYLHVIKDEEFKYEYFRLYENFKKFKIDSTSLVLKFESELLAEQTYEAITKLLRSLDMVTLVKQQKLFYICIFFPIADKAVAAGFLNRLLKSNKLLSEKQFEYMTFGYQHIHLFDEYINVDVSES